MNAVRTPAPSIITAAINWNIRNIIEQLVASRRTVEKLDGFIVLEPGKPDRFGWELGNIQGRHSNPGIERPGM